MPDDVGFDEGGIAQAIASMIDTMFKRPVYKQDTKEFNYNRKGLVIWESTKTWDISLGEVLIPLVIGGFISLTPLLLAALFGAPGSGIPPLTGGLADAFGKPALGTYINLYGNVLGPLLYAGALARYQSGRTNVNLPIE